MQRVVGIVLGYEDLVDHDELRHRHRTLMPPGKTNDTLTGQLG
jgi:hypothetical protein